MRFIYLTLTALLVGCSNGGGRLITVRDQEGRPLPGILTYPQPIHSGHKESTATGQLRVYPGGPNGQFVLIGIGYADAAFSFNDPRGIFVLEKVDSRLEAELDSRTRRRLGLP